MPAHPRLCQRCHETFTPHSRPGRPSPYCDRCFLAETPCKECSTPVRVITHKTFCSRRCASLHRHREAGHAITSDRSEEDVRLAVCAHCQAHFSFPASAERPRTCSAACAAAAPAYYRCQECPLRSTAAGLAKHQRSTGHYGRLDAVKP